MDADSSFVVAQVVPALSVPCGPVQEWAPETRKWGSLTFVPCSLDCQPLPFPHDRRGHCWRAAEERNEPCCGDGLLGHCRPLPAGRCRGSPRGGGDRAWHSHFSLLSRTSRRPFGQGPGRSQRSSREEHSWGKKCRSDLGFSERQRPHAPRASLSWGRSQQALTSARKRGAGAGVVQ